MNTSEATCGTMLKTCYHWCSGDGQ